VPTTSTMASCPPPRGSAPAPASGGGAALDLGQTLEGPERARRDPVGEFGIGDQLHMLACVRTTMSSWVVTPPGCTRSAAQRLFEFESHPPSGTRRMSSSTEEKSARRRRAHRAPCRRRCRRSSGTTRWCVSSLMRGCGPRHTRPEAVVDPDHAEARGTRGEHGEQGGHPFQGGAVADAGRHGDDRSGVMPPTRLARAPPCRPRPRRRRRRRVRRPRRAAGGRRLRRSPPAARAVAERVQYGSHSSHRQSRCRPSRSAPGGSLGAGRQATVAQTGDLAPCTREPSLGRRLHAASVCAASAREQHRSPGSLRSSTRCGHCSSVFPGP